MQFDSLPDGQEVECDAELTEFITRHQFFRTRETYWRPGVELNRWRNKLIPDVWSIVCLFLWNRNSTYLLSIPLKNLLTDTHRLQCSFLKYDFIGPEDEQEYRVASDKFDRWSTYSFKTVKARDKAYHIDLVFPYNIDLNRRFLINICT